ncbi:eCIS core domain-containing protein [Mycobacterium sp. 050134]|uniref:eCIS core domain-containing protein n=1 Tax=Mycobacterium sp. 050134 TaxID=3096111 RepID=UPI002ED973C3
MDNQSALSRPETSDHGWTPLSGVRHPEPSRHQHHAINPSLDFARRPVVEPRPGQATIYPAPASHGDPAADHRAADAAHPQQLRAGAPAPKQPCRHPALQRKCDCAGTCAECQSGQSEQHPRWLQPKASDGGLEHSTAPPLVHSVLQSPGERLDAGTRRLMEPRFGVDFSTVRVHADPTAAESARQVHAHAYTQGEHIVFAKGRYAPTTAEGRKLIGHELTHVVQQAAGRVTSPAAGGGASVATDGDLEHEADVAGETAARGGAVDVLGTAGDGGTQLKAANGSIQLDANSEDFKQGYEDGVNGRDPAPGPRSEDAFTDYNEGYTKGHYEFTQQTASQAAAAPSPQAPAAQNAAPPPPAPAHAAPQAPAPGGSQPSADYTQGYQDGLSGADSAPGPRDADALTEYDDGYARGHHEFTQRTASTPPGTQSDDYKQGYQDGVNGGEAAPGPRQGDALTDYNEGYAKGHSESSPQQPAAADAGAANAGSADDCLAGFDVKSASASDKLGKALLCSKDTIGEEIYNNLVGSLEMMVGLSIAFTLLQFVPGANVLVDGVAVIELIKIAVEAGLNYQMAVDIGTDVGKFLKGAGATSNAEVKAAGAALARAVGASTVLVLMLLIGGKGKRASGETSAPLPPGEYPAAGRGEIAKVTIPEGENASPAGEPRPGEARPGDTNAPGAEPSEGSTPGDKTADNAGPNRSEAEMSDGKPVAGEATSADGTREVKVGADGICEVCGSPCKEIRARYAEALKDPGLEAKLETAEGIEDFPSRAAAIAKLIPELEAASGREGSELGKLATEQAADQSKDVGLTDVDPKDANVLDLPEYQSHIADASDEFARLPDIENPKNIAGKPGAPPVTSGWAGEKGAATEQAQAEGREAGHETQPHYRDPAGGEGQYESSHSERQQAAGTTEQVFASSKPLCPGCQSWFGARAVAQGRPQFVADPTGVHVFMPNGSHTVAPHPSGAVTH